MLQAILFCSVALLVQQQCVLSTEVAVPKFTVNLDSPADVRFKEISTHFRSVAPALVAEINKLLPVKIQSVVEDVAEDFMKRLNPEHDAEMRAFAKSWNISVGYIVAANLLYDFTAACTSIVMQDNNGSIYHGRNLDYSFGGLLRNLTYIADFQRGGKTIYTLTTYAGYLGALTGIRHHSFSMSMDERNQGSIVENVLLALLDKKARPIGFLLRETFDTPGITFEGAVEKLSDAQLIAPAYIILGGVLPGEGAIITRSQLKAVDVYRIDLSSNRWYVLETNYDHWKPPPASDNRRDPAEKILNASGQTEAGFDLLQKVLNTPPVLNAHTTYTALMSAAHPEDYKSWVQRV